MSQEMSLERFRTLAAAYGGDVSAWPGTERAAAADLLARSEAAAAILADESALDAALADLARAAPDPQPSEALLARVLADAAATSAEHAALASDHRDARARSRRGEFAPLSLRWLIGGLSLAAASGLAVGVFAPIEPPRQTGGATFQSVAFDDETFLEIALRDVAFGDADADLL